MSRLGLWLPSRSCVVVMLVIFTGLAGLLHAGVQVTWTNTYGATGTTAADSPRKVVTDKEGNVVVIGTTDNDRTGKDWFIQKCKASTGQVLWNQRYNGPRNGDDVPNDVVVDETGAVIVTGISYPAGGLQAADSVEMYTAKFAGADGTLIWGRIQMGPAKQYERNSGIALTKTGDVVVRGEFGTASLHIGYLVRYAAASGSLLWEQSGELPCRSMTLDAEGDLYLTGLLSEKYITVKCSGADGSLLWKRMYGGYLIAIGTKGELLIAGVNSTNLATCDTGTGEVRASKEFPGTVIALDKSGDIVTSTPRAVYLAGKPGGNDLIIRKHSGENGNVLWESVLTGSWYTFLHNIDTAVAANGDVFVTIDEFFYGYSTYPYYPDGIQASSYSLHKIDGRTGVRSFTIAMPSSSLSPTVTEVKLALDGDGNPIIANNHRADGGRDYADDYDSVTTKYAGADGGVLWSQTYEGSGPQKERAGAVAADSKGNIYAGGSSMNDEGNWDLYMAKYEGISGKLIWEWRFDSGSDDSGMPFVTKDDDLITIGRSKRPNTALGLRVAKYAGSNGALIWERYYNERYGSATMNEDGSILLVCELAIVDGKRAFIIAKTDVEGAIIWEKFYTPWPADNFLLVARCDQNGDIIFVGTSKFAEQGSDWGVAKASGVNGNLLWARTYNGSADKVDRVHELEIDANGDVFVSGEVEQTGSAAITVDVRTVKYAGKDGAVLWDRACKKVENGDGIRVKTAIDQKGDLILATSANVTNSKLGYYTAKYAGLDGALIWETRFDNDAATDRPVAISLDSQGDVLVTGVTKDIHTAIGWCTAVKYSGVDGKRIWENEFNELPIRVQSFVPVHTIPVPGGGYAISGDLQFRPGSTFSSTPESDIVVFKLVERPLTPTALSAAASSLYSTGATLNATVNPNGESMHAVFEFGPTAELGQTTPAKDLGVKSNNLPFSFSLEGLAPATTYFFRVTASNPTGTVRGEILSFTTPGLPTPPTMDSIADLTVPEDSGLQTVSITGVAPGDPEHSVTLSVASDHPTLIPNPTVTVFTGTTRQIRFTPAPNSSGDAVITVTAKESGLEQASTQRVFTVHVVPVNEPPSFVKGSDQTVVEDSGQIVVPGWASQMSAGPVNEASQALHFEVNSDNGALFSAPPAVSPDGTLSFTPAPDANGNANVTVRLRDSGGSQNGGSDASAPQSFKIIVTPVNDAPSFVAGPDLKIPPSEEPQVKLGWAKNIKAGPMDESAQALSFTATTPDTFLFEVPPAVTPSGDLSFTLRKDATGTAVITLQLEDNGGQLNGGADASEIKTFRVTVTDYTEEVGTYNGLVRAAPGVELGAERSGLIRLTITSTGAFTGKLTFDGATHALAGWLDRKGVAHFKPTGATSLSMVRHGAAVRSLSLVVDVAGDTDKLSGTIYEGANTYAVIEADRALYTAKSNPVAPMRNVPAELLGEYTVVLAGRTPEEQGLPAVQFPQGDGVGLATVSKDGSVRLVATLANGDRVIYSNSLSKENTWPLYHARKQGSVVLGFVSLRDRPEISDMDAIGLEWFLPERKRQLYPEGWPTGIRLDLIGSKYHRAQSGESVIPRLPPTTATGNVTLTLTGGGLDEAGVSQQLNTRSNQGVEVVHPNAAHVSLNLKKATGLFSGRFIHPVSNKECRIQGVVLQKQARGAGFFRTKMEVGGVTLVGTSEE